MDYKNNVFISYTRGELAPWVNKLFAYYLNEYLKLEIGNHLGVFVDSSIESGNDWENTIKENLAGSQVMVCLLSPEYFKSEWCRREMALMMERENQADWQGRDKNSRLIIPVRLGDGDFYPDAVNRIQLYDLEEHVSFNPERYTAKANALEAEIKPLVKLLKNKLENIPDYNKDWLNFTGDDFYDQLESKGKNIAAKPSRIIVD